MAREITETLYRIKGYSGIPHYVECNGEEDLFRHIAKNWVIKGYPVSSVNRIDYDGSTPRVIVLTNKRFKEILKEEQTKA